MDRKVQFLIEAPDYPYDLAEQVLALLPDEWHTVIARPYLHGEWDTYTFGDDGWAFYEGSQVGSRYALVVVPVKDMLDDAIREKKLASVRDLLATPLDSQGPPA